ncbi:MAG: helix-turn-helix transcriptional regulator [Kiritimatiellae bacterium]|nr:helix-turn-helix transcriptional regulator [Kiritimatiellia bacterium]
MNEEQAAEFAGVFKALADPFRLRILDLLPSTPDCRSVYNVNELVEELGGSQPNMSHHLKVLKHAGVVKCKKMCSSVYFYRNREMAEHIDAFLKKLL